MNTHRALFGLAFAAVLCYLPTPARGDAYPVILRGKVTMQDGTPPPKSVGIERNCTDLQGSAPGPITDKKTGEWTWRMDVDPFKPRNCVVRATMVGYQSTEENISALNGVEKTVIIPTLILREKVANPSTIISGGFPVPGKSKEAWNDGIKAIDSGNAPEAIKQLKLAVAESPKFAQGWHTLGIIQDNMVQTADARASFEKAVEADPKLLAAHVMLARMCVKLKDWNCASMAADNYVKVDNKRTYPEIYMLQAVAKFGLKDMAGAEAAANEAVNPSQKSKFYRGEYVLARIAAEKGDTAAAKEHLAKYIAADPSASDITMIKAYQDALGKPEAARMAPEF